MRSDEENPVTASLKVTVTVNDWFVKEFPGALNTAEGATSIAVVNEPTGDETVVPKEFMADNLK